jgi:hypothetical protein
MSPEPYLLDSLPLLPDLDLPQPEEDPAEPSRPHPDWRTYGPRIPHSQRHRPVRCTDCHTPLNTYNKDGKRCCLCAQQHVGKLTPQRLAQFREAVYELFRELDAGVPLP